MSVNLGHTTVVIPLVIILKEHTGVPESLMSYGLLMVQDPIKITLQQLKLTLKNKLIFSMLQKTKEFGQKEFQSIFSKVFNQSKVF